MKPQILSLLLVFLFSISITACSNSKSTSDRVSSNKISDTSASVSPIFTPIDTPADSKVENKKTQIPSENNKKDSVVSEAYKAVLQNKAVFISTDENKKKVYLNEFLTNEETRGTTFKVTHFSVVDMDGDEIPEVVLELTPTPGQNPELFEALHYINGEVYGCSQVYRGLENLKMDGTFLYSGGASHNGYGKLRFESTACERDILGYHDTNNDSTSKFFIQNKPVTEDAYNSFSKEEDGKKDVVWYEFSQKNVETELAQDFPVEVSSTIGNTTPIPTTTKKQTNLDSSVTSATSNSVQATVTSNTYIAMSVNDDSNKNTTQNAYLEVEEKFIHKYLLRNKDKPQIYSLKQDPTNFIYSVSVIDYNEKNQLFWIKVSRISDTVNNFYFYNAKEDKYYYDRNQLKEIGDSVDFVSL
jgi:hypothetical protein